MKKLFSVLLVVLCVVSCFSVCSFAGKETTEAEPTVNVNTQQSNGISILEEDIRSALNEKQSNEEEIKSSTLVTEQEAIYNYGSYMSIRLRLGKSSAGKQFTVQSTNYPISNAYTVDNTGYVDIKNRDVTGVVFYVSEKTDEIKLPAPTSSDCISFYINLGEEFAGARFTLETKDGVDPKFFTADKDGEVLVTTTDMTTRFIYLVAVDVVNAEKTTAAETEETTELQLSVLNSEPHSEKIKEDSDKGIIKAVVVVAVGFMLLGAYFCYKKYYEKKYGQPLEKKSGEYDEQDIS